VVHSDRLCRHDDRGQPHQPARTRPRPGAVAGADVGPRPEGCRRGASSRRDRRERSLRSRL
jgi:hypothetical protein